ncbi:MAG TPA: glycosyltransferase [Steroidobacteraceae bacterium]|nr:glycosyltransferase [Steroidobacteraceae bacterium]
MIVSVYLPTRNRASLLPRAVDSVLAQSYRDLELIVVNDGSEDATVAYLTARAAADSRLRLLHNPRPLGAPRSRNRAITAARGGFVTGLDDDDSFHPDRIDAFVRRWRRLERYGERFSCLYTQDILMQGPRAAYTHKPERVEYADLFHFNSIGNQVFTRRDYLIGAGLFDSDMPAWQDLDAFIRLVARYGSARLVDRPLYFVDLEPRADRISVGSKERILTAYRRLGRKLESEPASLRQALFLQVFGRLYGFKLGLPDLREYLSYGVHTRTLRTLAGILARQAGLR